MSSPTTAFAAVDLGASSGRVMVGQVGPDSLTLTEAHRFANRPVSVLDTMHWDILALYREALDGLRSALRSGHHLSGIGVDSWGVDYGLLDATGALIGNPVHYRDARTTGVPEKIAQTLSPDRLYHATGIQDQPFNTVNQLVAAQGSASLGAARQLLMIPDLISYWLTGTAGAEITHASTTQLLNPRNGTWSGEVAAALGIELSLFPPLRHPGDPAGTLLPDVAQQIGADAPIPVTAVGSHDTASAVVAVPAEHDRFAYISCGTWSLAGMELPAPIMTEDSRLANFTNELGVDGTVRYLRNIMGLWLLQESQRAWAAAGTPWELADLLHRAGQAAPLRSVVDAQDPAFLAPGGMPERIADACRRAGQPVPQDPPATVRCILDSLALAHRRAIAEAQRLSGRSVEVVHIVGGGSYNELLCQLTADACDLPVVAGPAEATALGNLCVQARAAGVLRGGLGEVRALLRSTQVLRRYEPSGNTTEWAAAEDSLNCRVNLP